MNKKHQFDPLTFSFPLNWEESYDLEFKSAQGGLPKSLWESYSSLANTNGGIILLGVEDDGTINGLEKSVVKKIRDNFWDLVNNKEKISSNLITEKDVCEISHETGVILAIRVPRASRYQRPVFVGKNPLVGTYRRNNTGDYHCSEQEVKRMMSDSAEESADSIIVEGFTLDDLDQRSLQEYRRLFASHQPTHAWLSEDDIGFLTKLNGWKKSRNGSQEGVTLAGILMFGTDEAIREAVPQYQVDYREKLSFDPQVRWTDRVTIDGTWVANLFQFYLKVIRRLSQDLKLPFQLDENLIRKGESPVHVAVREALVNAIIHADYCGIGGVVIEKERDRFLFSNPGSLLISLDQILDQKSRSSISECRNKTLQKMFAAIGVAEKMGSGIDKIYRGWQSQHWRTPAVNEEFKPDRVRWILPMISLIPKESLLRLEERFGSKFRKLSQLEVQALVTADVEGYVDNSRMCQITTIHTTDVTKLLQSLVEQGMLFQENKSRWSRYQLNSLHKENHSLHKENHSLHKDFSDEEWLELNNLASTAAQSKRIRPKLMEEIIRKLCTNRWLSRRQLAELLNRNIESLLTRFLTQMVQHKILQMRYPDKPNRVDQAYTTSEVD